MSTVENTASPDGLSPSSPAMSPNVEPKRKVSILTDPTQQLGYDNLAFEGQPRRKISQVTLDGY